MFYLNYFLIFVFSIIHFLMFLMFTRTLIFYFLNHPLSMGLMLLIYTLLCCFYVGLISNYFWFSYILFLVFLGGILVLFIYVISLASNEYFIVFRLKFLGFLLILCLLFFFIIMGYSYFGLDVSQLIVIKTNFLVFFTDDLILVFKLYNYPVNIITIFLIRYLLFVLIVVVKVTDFSYGPLRVGFK